MNLYPTQLYGFLNTMNRFVHIVLVLLAHTTFGQDNKSFSTQQEISQNVLVSGNAEQIDDLHILRNSTDYYTQQAKNWKALVNADKKNSNAWYNYYKATRYSLIDQNTGQLDVGAQSVLDDIVADMDEVSESYEYNYIVYWNGNYDASYGPALLKANELNPKAAETYDDLIAYYEIEGDFNKKKEYCTKLAASGTIPLSIMTYNYNVLMSLKENAIIVTNGVNDTYPLWIWQHVKGFRRDVKIIALPLLQNDGYKSRLFKELNIKTPQTTVKKFKSTITEPFDMAQVIEENPSMPIYLGLTVNQNILKNLKNNLYVTGLAMRYSKSGFDNITELRKNWENDFVLEDLEKAENGHLKSNMASRQLDANYLIPALLLYEFYASNGLTANALKLRSLVTNIAKGSEKETTVSEYLANK